MTFGICFKQLFDTRYLVFCNLSPPRMFLPLNLLSEYQLQYGAIGPLYVTSSYSTWIFYRAVSGFATDCPCSVWCRGLTTCLLHVGPPFGNRLLNGEINRVRSRPVPGGKGPGRPKKTWDECVKQDLKVHVCGLSEAGTQDRVLWRSSVKNSRQEPTPSNGSATQSIAAPPAQRVLGMRTRSFNKTGFD